MPIHSRFDDASRMLGRMPPVDVVVEADVPLSNRTTFRIGGPARLLARCRSSEGVAASVHAALSCDIPWLVLGKGANTLVPDQGLEALVMVLEGPLAELGLEGDRLRAGGGATLGRAVREAMAAGLAGLECLAGIPGTIGGALAMNAGAQGQEILEVLAWADVVESDGTVRRMARSEVEGGYRWSVLGRGRIVTEALLQLRTGDPAELGRRAEQARQWRQAALPKGPSAGSVFRNPPGDFAGRLLEAAECKGLEIGGARVSGRHANIIVNVGQARSEDVRRLVAEMARRVRERFGVRLVLELKVLSEAAAVVSDPEVLE